MLLRAAILTPLRNGRLGYHADGALLIRNGRIAACGDYAGISAAHPDAAVRDLRGGCLLPGFVDAHVHFPQVRVIGGLGLELLDWLDRRALPEEARFAGAAHAARLAGVFVHELLRHGTTSALVFGAHFSAATAALFDAAAEAGLRMTAGLVLSDRGLRPELRLTPEAAYRESADLIRRYHARGRLRYAVTPRFALSASEAMLEVCQTLRREFPGLLAQTHLNENRGEIDQVARLFPWAPDYFGVYERFGLGENSVMAHNVHPKPEELERMAAAGTWAAHCPSSNAALASGIFPMAAHLQAGVPFALGTDVGAGTGFGLAKEALQAHLIQRLTPGGGKLTPAEMLYRATLAGAEALGLGGITGSLEPGKAADAVHWRAQPGTALAEALQAADAPDAVLGALFAQAEPEHVREVWIEGETVYRNGRRDGAGDGDRTRDQQLGRL